MELERALLEYFDNLYLKGRRVDSGTKLIAALGARWPVLHRSGQSGLLPRARCSLHGWSRLDPLTSRLPCPLPAVELLALMLLHWGALGLALAVLVATDAYIRPGELLALRVESVIPPRPSLGCHFAHVSLLLCPSDEGIASKTHQFDDSVVLDSCHRVWLSRAVLEFARRRPPGSLLFYFPAALFRQVVHTRQRPSASSIGTSPRTSSGIQGRTTTT